MGMYWLANFSVINQPTIAIKVRTFLTKQKKNWETYESSLNIDEVERAGLKINSKEKKNVSH